MKNEALKNNLSNNILIWEKALERLKKAEAKALKIDISNEISDDNFEILESLTSRFARAVDLLTQKIIRNIFYLLEERPETFIDSANLAEKLGLASSDDLVAIRRLRNKIAHEYEEENVIDIIRNTLNYIDAILLISENIKDFIKKRNLL